MTRIDESTLALHLEVSLSGAAQSLLADLAHGDRFRRMAAVSTLAQHLASRMRGFEVLSEDAPPQPMPLFPDVT